MGVCTSAGAVHGAIERELTRSITVYHGLLHCMHIHASKLQKEHGGQQQARLEEEEGYQRLGTDWEHAH
jgi:hypothetical protein